MVISEKRLRYLLDGLTSGMITADEKRELYDWINRSDGDEHFRNYVSDVYHKTRTEETEHPVNWENLFDRIREKSGLRHKGKSKVFSLFSRISVAAAVSALILGSVAFYLLKNGNDSSATEAVALITTEDKSDNVKTEDPSQAILKTSNNEVVLRANDTTFQLGGNSVSLADGQLSIATETAEEYTLITPKGTTYKIVLADGSAVWLNTDSEFTYPSLFTGTERRVKVKGEAYFEVAKDAARPFIVEADNQTIQVLGTSFNVQAYADEPQSVTTLVSGSLRVSAGEESVLLKPGQQTEWNEQERLKLKKKVDVSQAVAWKEDYFRFRETELKAMMRQLSRWYDVEVVYQPGLKPQYFAGVISRSNDISTVLKMIEATNDVKFSLKSKRLTVSAVK